MKLLTDQLSTLEELFYDSFTPPRFHTQNSLKLITIFNTCQLFLSNNLIYLLNSLYENHKK